MKRYTKNQIQSIIYEYGFSLVEFRNAKNIIAIDNDGYKYNLTLLNLRLGKKPNRFMRNPYAIENFKLYLSKNCPNYELLDSEYDGCKKKMKFICHNHEDKGIQENTVDNIVNNHHYCKYCSYEKMRDDRVLDENILRELCENRNVSYIGRYTKNHESYVRYICNKHSSKNIQEMNLTHFKESHIPCRFCNITAGELRISKFLDKYNVNYESEKIFSDCRDIKPLRFDFYLPDNNIIIEYDGKQHFEPVIFWYGQNAEENYRKNQRRDKIKNNYCAENNLKLLRIPYWGYNNIEKILASELSDVIFIGKITESSETAGCS